MYKILWFIVASTHAAFAICIAIEILCFKNLPALGSSVPIDQNTASQNPRKFLDMEVILMKTWLE